VWFDTTRVHPSQVFIYWSMYYLKRDHVRARDKLKDNIQQTARRKFTSFKRSARVPLRTVHYRVIKGGLWRSCCCSCSELRVSGVLCDTN
jgi:hypothetical protein